MYGEDIHPDERSEEGSLKGVCKMKLQVTHFLIFLGCVYIIFTFIIFAYFLFSKKFSISSRKNLEEFIDLKDSVINNLKSEIINLKSEINNLQFERDSLSQILEKREAI